MTTDAGPADVDLFPELDAERGHLALARHCRTVAIAGYERVLANPNAADEVTGEYIEATAQRALADLADPACAEFFGRIDGDEGTFHIGRRHLEDEHRDPVVVDWRARIAAPFYRATVRDNLGLVRRRRFTLRDGEVQAYNDEHLDDASLAEGDTGDVASGIPDPVLAEIGAARTGAMREIVATIQGEQDVVIRSPIERALVVQGGPGTGKTAVGLHRAAFLLFEHRGRLEREGVLVVGPNRVFLAYVANVLPSLGERSVDQRTLAELVSPKVDVTATDPDPVARLKGDARMAAVVAGAVLARIVAPTETVRVPLGARTVVLEPDTLADWIARALAGTAPLHVRRQGLRALAQRELQVLTGRDDAWTRAEPLRRALNAAWPTQKPADVVKRLLRDDAVLATAAAGRLTDDEQAALLAARPRRHAWTAADAVLVDEAAGLLDGPPRTWGHVVVDEAQDLSAMALRAVGRRGPSGSFTILGDLAQSTAPGGQESWDDALAALGAGTDAAVEHLTIGYRVPAPVLEVANELLTLADVAVPASRSARLVGDPPRHVVATEAGLAAAATEALVEVRGRHALSGVIAPAHRLPALAAALAERGLVAVDHLDHLGPDDVPLLSAEASKGLELDGVVAVDHEALVAAGPRGVRLAYVMLTRAVQELTLVSPDRPAVLTKS